MGLHDSKCFLRDEPRGAVEIERTLSPEPRGAETQHTTGLNKIKELKANTTCCDPLKIEAEDHHSWLRTGRVATKRMIKN